MSALRCGLLVSVALLLAIATAVLGTRPTAGRLTQAGPGPASKESPGRIAMPARPVQGFAAQGDLVAEAYRGDAHARSQLCTGAMLGGEQTGSYQEAAYWCALGAEAGDADAQAAYARLFQIGGGVVQDDAQAASWYEKAIAQRNAHAMYMRGRMLIAGNDAAEQSLGRMLLQQAAAMGDSNAQWALRNEDFEPEKRRNDQTLLN